jgi:hypothetical protein
METPHGDTSPALDPRGVGVGRGATARLLPLATPLLDPRGVGDGRGAAARVLPEATPLPARFQVLVRVRSLALSLAFEEPQGFSPPVFARSHPPAHILPRPPARFSPCHRRSLRMEWESPPSAAGR